MEILKIILTVIFVIVCVALIVIVLMQEGKGSGLSGSIAGGSADTYVNRNKGRTPEGKKIFYTKILIAVFMVVALILNLL